MGRNKWLDGVMGLIVGDALGVPVEFRSRNELMNKPVESMRAYGTYNQPAGTWSDDSSMTLATVDSLKNGYDPKDIMDKFVKWIMQAEYTPFQCVFDKGIATHVAISKYIDGESLFSCGGENERSNGNGSLMRILPVCIYAYEQQKKCGMSDEDVIDMIHEVSALTHAHIRSLVACGLYFFMVRELLEEKGTLADCLQKGLDKGFEFYKSDMTNPDELLRYGRIRNITELAKTDMDEIYSSGYVVYSLEAALWCLMNTDNYRDCMLKAVNLGSDTDTVAAIAGGLAGLFYGYDDIPQEWLDVIQRKSWIEEMLGEISR